MKNGIKLLLVTGLLFVVSIFAASAYYGPVNESRMFEEHSFESGEFHNSMESIVESGSYTDLEVFRVENDGFGGPRWVTDEESFNQWKERHEYMESNGFEPGSMRGSGSRGGCPMRG